MVRRERGSLCGEVSSGLELQEMAYEIGTYNYRTCAQSL
jgi:hypothetical protein